MSTVTLSLSLAVITDEIGSIWSATVFEVKGRTSIDWQSIAMHFEPSRQLITAHTTTGEASLSAKLAKI